MTCTPKTPWTSYSCSFSYSYLCYSTASRNSLLATSTDARLLDAAEAMCVRAVQESRALRRGRRTAKRFIVYHIDPTRVSHACLPQPLLRPTSGLTTTSLAPPAAHLYRHPLSTLPTAATGATHGCSLLHSLAQALYKDLSQALDKPSASATASDLQRWPRLSPSAARRPAAGSQQAPPTVVTPLQPTPPASTSAPMRVLGAPVTPPPPPAARRTAPSRCTSNDSFHWSFCRSGGCGSGGRCRRPRWATKPR